MARLIVKSPYFKGGGAKPAGGYLRYIATRERVEILPDDRPPTKRQTQLIEKLTKDFPDTKTLLEYGDYTAHPTKFNASQFLTLAMEENWGKVQEIDGYAKYIATRPRAERMGEHGLFGDEDAVDLNAAMAEVNSCTGNIWTHIISLRREDAERLGFDHADAWRALLRAHRNDIAEAMHIPPEDFRWYAAFHDEGGHPHVHMMAWSKKPGQAYLELAARQDHVAAQYALGRLLLSDDLEVQNPAQGFYWLERAAESGNDCAAYQLGKEYLSGKNAPKEPERAVEYVRMAAEQGNPYAQYLLGKLCLSGDGVPQDKNAAYDWFQKAQAQGHDYAGFFMDRIERPEPPNVLLSATRLLYHMGKIFQSSAPAPQSCGVQIDRKRLAKLRRMRMAAGHKADDHEQEQRSSTMSMGW